MDKLKAYMVAHTLSVIIDGKEYVELEKVKDLIDHICDEPEDPYFDESLLSTF